MGFPRIRQTVIDATDVREVAEFYRQLFGFCYRDGDEPAPDGPDDADWLVLTDADGRRVLAFQQVERLAPTTWPSPDVPMQLHLDSTVPDAEELERQRGRAEALGARLARDRTDDPHEPLYVLADPAGHPFCIFVDDGCGAAGSQASGGSDAAAPAHSAEDEQDERDDRQDDQDGPQHG